MKKILLLTFITLISCNNRINEDIAIKAVANFYKGSYILSQGVKVSNNNKTVYYELEIRNSELMDLYNGELDIPASNAALIFYSNSKNKINIDKIIIKIYQNNILSIEKEFDVENLERILQKKKVFNNVYAKISNNKYNDLFELFSEEVRSEMNLKSFVKLFEEYNDSYGSISDIINQGYSIGRIEYNNKNVSIISFMSTVKRDSINTKLNVFIDEKTDKLFSISFDW